MSKIVGFFLLFATPFWLDRETRINHSDQRDRTDALLCNRVLGEQLRSAFPPSH